ncbi:MAG: hypothetical protein V1698_00960 [bacterium]
MYRKRFFGVCLAVLFFSFFGCARIIIAEGEFPLQEEFEYLELPATTQSQSQEGGDLLSGYFIVPRGWCPNQVASHLEREYYLESFGCKEFRWLYRDFLHGTAPKNYLYAGDSLPLNRLNPYRQVFREQPLPPVPTPVVKSRRRVARFEVSVPLWMVQPGNPPTGHPQGGRKRIDP